MTPMMKPLQGSKPSSNNSKRAAQLWMFSIFGATFYSYPSKKFID
jgi:hypothetical protein